MKISGLSHGNERPAYLFMALSMIGMLAISLSLDGCTGRVEGGCNADPDCEGDLVCRQGECVDPCSGVQCDPGEVCVAGVCKDCSPDCGGRECGPDPQCATSCGTCSGGKVCEDGVCICLSHASQACHQDDVWWLDSCGQPEEMIADCQQGCDAGQCLGCTPDCTGRECGPDPECGASCGTCTPPQTCDASGQCECVPDCAGLECGPDQVCGIECGPCTGGLVCVGGSCETSVTAVVFLEAEQIDDLGGWKLDSQFVDVMGSAYLLAHGMGEPVADATTSINFPKAGTYRLWVRTRDWVDPHAPGRFRVSVGGTTLPVDFGTNGPDWAWQDGGTIEVTGSSVAIRLQDQTGFDGRCDALFFTTDLGFTPPVDPVDLASWRRQMLGLPETAPVAGNYDLVVVGGGIAGTSAAVAAARLGLSVALIQDRPVLGGNASREIRIPTSSILSGKIVDELNTDWHCLLDILGMDLFLQFDVTRHAVVKGEPNIHLYLLHRATGVTMNGSEIESVTAMDLRTGDEIRFLAPYFVDSTGDGWIGFWADADFRTGREAQSEFGENWAPENADEVTLGNTLMFMSEDTGSPTSFPDVSDWTREVVGEYMAIRNDWSWEYGGLRGHLDTIYDAEHIRDHLLRAIYGSFYNAQKSEFSTYRLTWVGYVAGKRESRRLIGDVVLKEQDIIDQTHFDDAVVTSDYAIDLHFPGPWFCRNCESRWDCREGRGRHCDYLWEVSEKPCPCDELATLETSCYFRSNGVFLTSPHNFNIPYRSLYSRNINNLFMAGRNISTTHVAFGGTRVMNICGQMGVAVGTAASLCRKYNVDPRGLYLDNYVPALIQAVRNWQAIVLDNDDDSGITVNGSWSTSTVSDDRFGPTYLHDNDSGKGEKSVRFTPDLIPYHADYQVYMLWNSYATNRATNVPVIIHHSGGNTPRTIDQTKDGGRWVSLGTYHLVQGTGGYVEIHNDGTDDHVIADAVNFFPRDIIVDNAHADGVSLTGSWTGSTATPGHYGPDYIHDDNTAKGEKSVTFAPALPFHANYAVFLRWSSATNGAHNVPVEIIHDQGRATVPVDQSSHGGEWVLLGVYPFRAGNSGRVIVHNHDTDGFVIADAVKFTPVIVMDNREAHGVEFFPYRPDNSSNTWTGSSVQQGQYWASDYIHDNNTGKGQRSVRFTPLLPFSGSYRVYFRWTDGNTRAHNVPVDVIHAGGTSPPLYVDQRTRGGKWNLLGTFNFAQGTAGGVLIRTNGTSGHVVVDAVMFEPI